jgi:tetratricopeptide (TPR) repeat protein
VFFVALGAHARSLGAGFVFDDTTAVLRNPTVQGPLSPRRLLATDFWGAPAGHGTGTWRPLASLSFWIDRHVGGGAAWIFHLDNLVLHALVATLLALAVARRRDALAGLIAGVVFAAFAASTEAVTGVVGRADLLAAALALAAWLAADRGRAALAALAIFAALLAKESAIVAPIWILGAALIERRPRREIARMAAWGALAVAAYVALRARCLGFAVRRDAISDPLVAAGVGTRVLTGLALTARAARTIVAPIRLAPDYSFAAILPARGIDLDVMTGALLLAGCAVVVARRSASLAAAGALIFLVTWGFVANVIYPLPTIFAERLLYLPAAGVALALAAAPRRAWSALLLGILVVANLARGVVRDGDWRDDLALWTSAVRVTPDDARAWENLGAALRGHRRSAEAADAFDRAAAIRPEWALPHALGGLCREDVGDADGAERELGRAVELEPDDVESALNLAVVLARHGKLDGARATVDALLARHADPRALELRRQLNK